MCLYPKYGKNKRYLPNKKNGGDPPVCTDKRLLIVPYKCGKCYECRKQKAREWSVRLMEELEDNFGYFITLSFSPKAFSDLYKQTGLWWEKNPNELATKALRLCLERIRKQTGKSVKHWFVTELGEEKDRLHLHGIIFGQKSAQLFQQNWNYGNIYMGQFCNLRTVNYIVKYMLKADIKHPEFTGIVLASKGIGDGYIKKNKHLWQKNNYKQVCVATYTFRNGQKMAMPKYYKDKVFSEKERETMWLNNLERGIMWIGGEKVKADDFDTIDNLREYYQQLGRTIYFDNPENWDRQKQRRKAERQRRYVIEGRREKPTRKHYRKAMPSQAVFAGQENRIVTNNFERKFTIADYVYKNHDNLLRGFSETLN